MEPAFPVIMSENTCTSGPWASMPGLSKRELFAAMMMHAMLSSAVRDDLVNPAIVAAMPAVSAIYADALLAELAPSQIPPPGLSNVELQEMRPGEPR